MLRKSLLALVLLPAVLLVAPGLVAEAPAPAPALADLTVSLFIRPIIAPEGYNLNKSRMIARVTNMGDLPTGPFTVDFVMSTDEAAPIITANYNPNFQEDVLLLGGRVSIGNVNPGAIAKVPLGLKNTIPANTPGGLMFVGAVADSGSVIPEADLTNNLDFIPVIVQ